VGELLNVEPADGPLDRSPGSYRDELLELIRAVE